MPTQIIPLKKRPLDIAILGFFIFNAVFISYFVDLEQVVIPNTASFQYPVWPPHFLVDAAHWFGKNVDPLLYARPVWWRATIWMDVLLFGPFYFVAIYAFYKGRKWIRLPSIIFSAVMLTNVTIILSEEIWGPHATPHRAAVIGANASWIIFPILVMWRMWASEDPFAEKKATSHE
jgi:hypothetical protein